MKNAVPRGTYKIIMANGKPYYPKLLPEDIPRGRIGDCFDHCAIVAFRSNGKYKYVEGLASPMDVEGELILHAWLTDEKGSAFDPTWLSVTDEGNETKIPAVYYGVEFPVEAIISFAKLTGYKSLLGNRWRAPAAVDKYLKEGVLK